MNNIIIKEISHNLNVKDNQVIETLKLLEEGNTIPFIARYRKEVTGNLDEEQIRSISEVYEYQVSLLKRKEDVIRLIDEKQMLTEELRTTILNCTKLIEVEDLYRPFKEKKKTKATEAIANGLEDLSKYLMSFPKDDINAYASKFLSETVTSTSDALLGASYIIAEQVSDNASYRKWIRNFIYLNGMITAKKKNKVTDDNKVYEMYYDYQYNVKHEKPHRVLAINRGENEGILNVNISVDNIKILEYLESKVILNSDTTAYNVLKDAIADSYKRLIFPSIEREIRAELTEKAEISAIDNFGHNLEKLLLQPPMKDKMVLALDPAYRTGCKLAVIDFTGKKIDIKVIYPHEPRNEYDKSKSLVLELINKYNVDIIAIGNGTASRESETFIVDVIKECTRKVSYIIVNEAGASVYSASKLAIEEFPELHVEERSAISIGRRLQDPLSELVKIDPESIGVGLYQHDVSNKKLKESLDFVVSKVVNQVGVNINTASSSLLKYVSGISKKHIDKIIEYRDTKGKILSRIELKKLLSDKVYEQAIGFLRITEGKNVLDQTAIHPESYESTLKLLSTLNSTVSDIGTEALKDKLETINKNEYKDLLKIDIYTLEDIINNLIKPNRDPRDNMPKPLLREDILTLDDLKVGMKLQGTVRNVVDFGVFIDIGLKNDGLAHISKLTNRFIKHPNEVVGVGDIVDVYIDEIFLDKKKVALSLIDTNK
jgi:protein Tex